MHLLERNGLKGFGFTIQFNDAPHSLGAPGGERGIPSSEPGSAKSDGGYPIVGHRRESAVLHSGRNSERSADLSNLNHGASNE